MPHLAENLRYTTTHSQQCLDQLNAASLFPILSQPSFAQCKLVQSSRALDNSVFELVCQNQSAATGTALFVINRESFRATLNVKMGGKNMKFSQHISGSKISACS